MKFFSKRKSAMYKQDCIEKEFASEIVEIFEEQLEKLNTTLPGKILNNDDKERRIKSDVRNELIYEIESLIYSNKQKLSKQIA